jgi:hypothetical protein
MNTTVETIPILIAGDVIVDRHFYDSGGDPDGQVFAKPELGGAAALYRLLHALTLKKRQIAEARRHKEIRERKKAGKNTDDVPPVPKIDVHFSIAKPPLAALPPRHNAYAVWAPFPRTKDDKKTTVWRAARPMGYGKAGKQPKTEYRARRIKGVAPRVLVLDDGGFDFRLSASAGLWCLPAEKDPAPDWLVLKMSSPVARGDLWYALRQKFADKLVCIVSAKELRGEKDVCIGTGTSWERTIEDLSKALTTNTVLKSLDACRHLIVTFSVDGALWIHRTAKNTAKATLIFDSARAEGEWGEAHDGTAFGFLSCMTAAVAESVAEHVAAGKPSLGLGHAIGIGLNAMRDLLNNGHGPHGPGAPLPDGYPTPRLAQFLAETKSDFAIKEIGWPRSVAADDAWIMVSGEPSASRDARLSVISGISRQIVINGDAALRATPHARFGALVTADRSEIEALRGLRRLMRDYRAKAKPERPLSIGVFGPPGAGKSFGVKQLATEVFGKEAWLEFNLSQFDGPADLVGAFHQVRDRVLGGVTPVVFWDEFDSRAYFWLQYLLAPMQDGRFQDDQLNHAIGKCVFVFAGGTCFSFDEFKAKGGEEAAFKLAKAPDFKSRLDGYYDVLGPNQRVKPDEVDVPDPSGPNQRPLPDKEDVPEPSDICYPLRRALFMRAKFLGDAKGRLDIDPDLLEALLRVNKYKHGARSLEKLVLALKPPKGGQIQRSSLPPPAQLAMHVQAEKFNEILAHNASYRISQIIEHLAASIHENWREESKSKAPRLDVPYAKLAPIDQEDNRAAARRIPDVLALVGLGLATQEEAKSAKKPDAAEIRSYIESHIELLAEAEHDGWMSHRAKNGWRYGAPRKDTLKLHPLMVPYGDLPDVEKEKDRSSVLNYQAQADAAGLVIVWL